MSAKRVSASSVGRPMTTICQWLLVTPLVGCGLDPCPGVAQDMRFELEVLGPNEPDNSCLDTWGFVRGVIVEGRVAKLLGEYDCRAGVPEIESVGDWSWTGHPNAEIHGGVTLEGLYTMRRDTCSAGIWLILSSESFGCDASRGERCVLEVRINPVGAGTSCPPICSGRLNVRATRL